MLNLESPGSLKLLSDQIKADVDAFCVHKYNEGPRGHLGASLIGHPCSRYLWYNFRWVYHQVETGRQYRLYQRGHLEEQRIHDYLLGIGCIIRIFAEGTENVKDKGKRQIRISGCQGHFAGSLDGIIRLPERYEIEQDVLFLGEYKTQGTQKFQKLIDRGVQQEKYQHFCQQSIYGYKLGLQYAIYIAVNKNDDDLHIEVIKLDYNLAKLLEQKAENIIFATEPPAKVAANPNAFSCRWCNVAHICWNDSKEGTLINCRSCRRAMPVDNTEWFCNKYGAVIPKEFIKNGCENWEGLI